MNHRRVSEAGLRSAERRQREDEAKRLHDVVPKLSSLRLEIEERRGGGKLSVGAHIRRIVVESAPALFFVTCGDRSCKDGGHDLTSEIMSSVLRSETRFEGEHTCDGQLGTVPCGTALHYVGFAEYAG